MFAELRLVLECNSLNFRHSSNLQGFIMETIASEYCNILHQQKLNPYSQYLEEQKKNKIWHICTLTEEAYENIIVPMTRINEFQLKHGTVSVKVLKKEIQTLPNEALLEEFYQTKGSRYLDLKFQSPTAFKSNGAYIFYPDLRLIYQSLMNKYSMTSAEMEMRDEETLEQLVDNSEIVRYYLRTVPFPLEGVNITGFQGEIRIRIKGTDTMARYARLLLRFGEYSGIGIKTGIGMGAIKLTEREGKT